MRKFREIIVFVSIIVIMLLAVLVIKNTNNGKTVKISVDGEVLYTLSLDTDREIELPHNTVIIKDGKVWVSAADCENQICVNTPPVDSSGGAIICLPNKVAVEVLQNEN